jgi:hypothetical protein
MKVWVFASYGEKYFVSSIQSSDKKLQLDSVSFLDTHRFLLRMI